MFNLNVYREVKSWKKPVHLSRALAAKSYLSLLKNTQVIGITGSVGKTLTQNAIASVLSQKFKVMVGDENLDPTFRIPKTILATKPWHQKLVLEYGVEHPGDMDHYLGIAKPNIAVITSIAPTHTKYFRDENGVFAEKVKLIEALTKNDTALLNADDPKVTQMADRTKAKVIWYGQRAKEGIKISHFKQSLNGSKFRLHKNGDQATVSWRIIGRHQLLSAYAAATVGLSSGLTLKQIAKGLSQVKPPLHRLNAISTKNFKIIDDTYNASPKAAIESVNTLLEIGKRQPKIAIFGEMKDLGKLSQSSHEKLGEKIAKTKINYLFTIGKVTELIGKAAKKNGFGGKIVNFQNTKDAVIKIRKVLNNKTLILVKGSRHTHLERIIRGLQRQSTKIHCNYCGYLD